MATRRGALRRGDAPIAVVTSTNVYESIVTAIGGDRVEVESLITDPAADPHSYESTPADAVRVSDAQVVVYNGGGYDDFMPRLVEAGGKNPTVLDVAEVSGLVPAEEAGAEHADGEEEHEHGSANEHLWYSMPAMQALATRIAEALGELDPSGAAGYRANAQTFRAGLDELLTRAEAIGAANQGARVAVTEPVPGYLIESAGLTDVTPPEFSEAVEEDTDPPAAVVHEMLALFQGEPVRALILNEQTETPTTDQVRRAAETVGVPVVDVSETLPDGVADYVTWMGGQIDALAAAVNQASDPNGS